MKTKLNLKKILIVSIFLNLLLLGSFAYLVFSSNGGTFYISQGVYPSIPTYTIWTEGSTYYAKNHYGKMLTYGSNACQIVQNTLGHDRTVLLKAGNYYFSGSVNGSYNGLTIMGEGKEATMLYATKNLGETINDKPSGIFYVGYYTGTTRSKRVRICNLGLDGQGYHMTHLIWFDKVDEGNIDHVYVTNANTSNCGGWIDLGSASWRCSITNCVAKQGANGFANEGFFHAHASSSIITNCVSYGGYDSNTPAIKGGEFGATISGNTIHYSYTGILAESEGHSLTVTNNYIFNARSKAIWVKADKNNGVIDGNIIWVVNETAIDVRANNFIVSNNWISNVTKANCHGIHVEGNNNQILGNHVENITLKAIELKNCLFNIVSDNFVKKVGQGILLDHTNRTIVNGNIVIESSNNGIKVQDGIFNSISANEEYNCSSTGIYEGGSSDYNAFGENISPDGITISGSNSNSDGNNWNGTTWV